MKKEGLYINGKIYIDVPGKYGYLLISKKKPNSPYTARFGYGTLGKLQEILQEDFPESRIYQSVPGLGFIVELQL